MTDPKAGGRGPSKLEELEGLMQSRLRRPPQYLEGGKSPSPESSKVGKDWRQSSCGLAVDQGWPRGVEKDCGPAGQRGEGEGQGARSCMAAFQGLWMQSSSWRGLPLVLRDLPRTGQTSKSHTSPSSGRARQVSFPKLPGWAQAGGWSSSLSGSGTSSLPPSPPFPALL